MAFEELKQRQGVVWGSAPFENLASSIADVHEAIVEAMSPAEEKRWLEVACGTGELARLAARRGASVVGVDLAPALVETAKRQAADEGLSIDYRVGDAEKLDVEDASFDVVTSTFGVMFAPDQPRAAAELARVTKPGGRLGLATWLPTGGVGAMFGMMAPFQPPLPDGAGMPLDWGRPEYVEELLGEAFELAFEEHVTTVEFESSAEYWQEFSANFGPMKTLVGMLDDGRREELRGAWDSLFESPPFGSPGGPVSHSRDYLLITGTRR
jgi:ubiquinone/menaquinone biosynthesis C-methylase UbiE